jgi:sensor histidine kinase YesM
MEFLDHYLLIEQIRFGDRLTIKKHVDPRALDAVVPYLLLQPIVENALHHGIGTIPGPGTVEISADRPNGLVVLSVADNGPGLVNTVSPDNHLGVGLSNIRARLSQLYGEKHTFVLENISGGGVKVTVTIPSVDAE